jgi:uncharacterized protein involved in exopolysaccharide biosynthesis
MFRAARWGLCVALLVSFLLPKKYESTTKLMPPDEQSAAGMALMSTLSGKMAGGLGGLAGDILGAKTSGALFIGILGSRSVQDRVIEKFDLRKVYGRKSLEATRKKLAANTSLAEDRKSGLIAITVTDPNPERAAGLAKEYVTQLNAVSTQLSTSSARREREFLESRLQEVQRDLESAEKDFSQFASKNSAIDIKEQGKALVDAAATLQGQLIAAGSELQGLRQVYSEANVRVRTLNARVTELRSQLEKLGGEQEIGKDLTGKDLTSKDLTSPKEESLYPSIRKLPLLGVPYADLYRRTKVQEAVFETLTQEYELAKVAEAKETPSVKVLDPADIPERRLLPLHLFPMMLLGACLAAAAAAARIFAAKWWQEIESSDPRKLLAQDIFRSLEPRMAWVERQVSRWRASRDSKRENASREKFEPSPDV